VRHTKRKILPFVFASGLLASSLAQAAQLGKLEVLSGAGEPFLAQIQVDLVLPEERASLQAKLASAEAFKAARLTMDPNLKNLQFAVQNGSQPGTALVKITSAQPLPAGFIDTLVELTWAGGRVAREYTLSIPVGQAQAEQPVTRLPEIRPPMAPPTEAKPVAPATPPTPPVAQQTPKPAATLAPEGTRQVARGDTLSELALELVGEGVTLNQAMAALYEANKDSFINGSVHLIREGAQIQVPNRAALRARSANEALLILAQNDDRNVYSAYARQIGLLTVENQSTAAAATSSQGSIAPQEKPTEGNAAQADRLQIAPGAAQGSGSADASAEELLAKSKALSEANERIALLEKNVSDLQRLLDMQNDVGADEPKAPGNAAEGTSDGVAPEDSAAPVDAPSEPLPEDSAQTPAPDGEAVEGVESPTVETPAPEDAPFDWMPWLLAGAGGLAVLLVLLLIARARRNQKQGGDDTESDDELDFSEVKEFDEAVAAASAGASEEKAIGLNKSENSNFDLDEVLNERLKPVEPKDEEVTRIVEPIVPADPEPIDGIPELKEESEEAMQQTDSLNSDVKLDFPEDETVVEKENPIFDDLDMLEKGALSAQEELDQIRKQPLPGHDADDKEVSDAFDDLVDADLPETVPTEAQVNSKAGVAADNAVPESDFDQAMVELDVDVPNPKVDDATWQEVATKLDLAGAYVEIGDADGAKELLNEIVSKGDVDQVRKAKALLASLN